MTSVLLINRFFSAREDFVLPRSQSAGAGKTIGQASLGTSPSPRPSPGGRGRTGGVTCSNRSSLRSQQEPPQRRSCTARSRSPNALSLRERVGVRGRRSARKSPNAKTSGAPHIHEAVPVVWWRRLFGCGEPRCASVVSFRCRGGERASADGSGSAAGEIRWRSCLVAATPRCALSVSVVIVSPASQAPGSSCPGS